MSWTRGLVKFWPCIFFGHFLFLFFNIALLGTVSSSFIMELLVGVAGLDAELCVTERRYEIIISRKVNRGIFSVELLPDQDIRVATCQAGMPSIV